MGVNIAELFPKKEIKIDNLKGKPIAIDSYNALYQFLSSIRQRDGTPLMDSEGNVTSHLQGLFTRTVNLMGQGLKLCYVFDGTPPALKFQEQESRSQRKREAEIKYKKAIEEEEVDEMYKYSKQFSRLNKDMVAESKELISALGLPVIQAPSEAEAQAAMMCKKGDVWAVASQDADALLFGSPRLIRNLTLSQKRRTSSGKYIFTFLEMIELKDVLKESGITHDQLIALGILVGTDFNRKGVKGIGPKKAVKLVKEKKKLPKIFEGLEVDFDWKEIYDIFTKIETTKKYKLRWGKVDRDKVKEILVERHEFSEDRVDSTLDKIKGSQNNQKGLSEFL